MTNKDWAEAALELMQSVNPDELDGGQLHEHFARVSQHIPIEKRLVSVVEALMGDTEANLVDIAFGLQMGVAAACLHPEWARALFTLTHPSDAKKEEAAQAMKHLVELLPIIMEQEE